MKWLSIFYILIGCNLCSAQCQNIDIDLLKYMNGQESTVADHSFSLISKSVTPISLGSPIIHLVVGVCLKDKALQKKSLLMGLQITTAMCASTILKYAVNRNRPYEEYAFIHNKASDFTPSFPSGHTNSAFATATALSLTWRRWYVVVPSYAWAASVGYSRLYLGAHYPSDVLAGAVLGSASAWLTWEVNKWLQQNKEKRKQPKMIISQ